MAVVVYSWGAELAINSLVAVVHGSGVGLAAYPIREGFRGTGCTHVDCLRAVLAGDDIHIHVLSFGLT